MRPPPCDDPTDAARCTNDDATKATTCMEAVAAPNQANYESLCTYVQGMYGCYPPCFCSGDDHKADREATEEGFSGMLKLADSTKTCKLKCGSAAGLRAGAVTTLLLAAFALLAGH